MLGYCICCEAVKDYIKNCVGVGKKNLVIQVNFVKLSAGVIINACGRPIKQTNKQLFLGLTPTCTFNEHIRICLFI